MTIAHARAKVREVTRDDLHAYHTPFKNRSMWKGWWFARFSLIAYFLIMLMVMITITVNNLFAKAHFLLNSRHPMKQSTGQGGSLSLCSSFSLLSLLV